MRLTFESGEKHESQRAAIEPIAGKIGCTGEVMSRASLRLTARTAFQHAVLVYAEKRSLATFLNSS